MAVVLAFNLPDEALSKLRILCVSQKIRLNAVGRDRYGCTLDSLVSGSAEAGEEMPEFAEPMLLMASFARGQFNLFLQGLKRRGIPNIPLKAVLTKHNAEWTAAKLYEELNAEREAFKNGASAHPDKTEE